MPHFFENIEVTNNLQELVDRFEAHPERSKIASGFMALAHALSSEKRNNIKTLLRTRKQLMKIFDEREILSSDLLEDGLSEVDAAAFTIIKKSLAAKKMLLRDIITEEKLQRFGLIKSFMRPTDLDSRRKLINDFITGITELESLYDLRTRPLNQQVPCEVIKADCLKVALQHKQRLSEETETANSTCTTDAEFETMSMAGSEDKIIERTPESVITGIQNNGNGEAPGGAVLRGHMAQEEYLCSLSNLLDLMLPKDTALGKLLEYIDNYICQRLDSDEDIGDEFFRDHSLFDWYYAAYLAEQLTKQDLAVNGPYSHPFQKNVVFILPSKNKIKKPVVRNNKRIEEEIVKPELAVFDIGTAIGVDCRNKLIAWNTIHDPSKSIKENTQTEISKLLIDALVNNNEVFEFGALGCGVFNNNPRDIALWYAEVLMQFAPVIRAVGMQVKFSIFGDAANPFVELLNGFDIKTKTEYIAENRLPQPIYQMILNEYNKNVRSSSATSKHINSDIAAIFSKFRKAETHDARIALEKEAFLSLKRYAINPKSRNKCLHNSIKKILGEDFCKQEMSIVSQADVDREAQAEHEAAYNYLMDVE